MLVNVTWALLMGFVYLFLMTIIFVKGIREMSCMIYVCSFLFRLRGWRLRKKKIRCLDEVTERGKRWITPISSPIENSWMYVYN